MTGNSRRRLEAETPLETAERLRAQYGITLSDEARKPLPRKVFDDMCGDTPPDWSGDEG